MLDYELSMNQLEIAQDITSGLITLDRYMNDLKNDYLSDDIAGDPEYIQMLEKVFREAIEFREKIESKMIEASDVLVEDNHSEFIPVGKSELFDYVD